MQDKIEIRKAMPADCLAIAELALIAGDGIPGYFWAQSQKPGQTLEETGAGIARSAEGNFSYQNAYVACFGNAIAGMLLAYRLPNAEDNDENPADFPLFVQPLVELEQCVPGSFYINMLAAYPQFRGQGIGTQLLSTIDSQAKTAGCQIVSIEVFEHNTGALRLYQRIGFRIIEQRSMVASDYLPAGEVLLLTRDVN